MPGAQVFSDIKSGLNFKRPGLQKLLTAVMENKISTIYITYEDRLARFGFSLIEWLCQQYRTDIHVLYEQEPETPHEELAKDLVSIVTSFSARLYGLRSHKTKRLLQTLKEVEKDTSSSEMEVV